jgi:uncharacterized membrane protein HdeD (DUF308 family)
MQKHAHIGGTAMTSPSDAQAPHDIGSGVEALRAERGYIVALGIIDVLAGLIALSSVVTATVASVFVVGAMVLIASVAEVINAFQVRSWGKFLPWMIGWQLAAAAALVLATTAVSWANDDSIKRRVLSSLLASGWERDSALEIRPPRARGAGEWW